MKHCNLLFQLVLFASDRSQFADFLERNEIAMKHLLLKDWSRDFETMPYPPSTGAYAIYTIDDLLQHINYTVKNVRAILDNILFLVNLIHCIEGRIMILCEKTNTYFKQL